MIGNMLDDYVNREHAPGQGPLKHSVYYFKGNVGAGVL
jgi:unsaturated chondroitin disaccharide hydrolase